MRHRPAPFTLCPEPVKVFRVETVAGGAGAYSGGFAPSEARSALFDATRHPCPYDDRKIGSGPEWVRAEMEDATKTRIRTLHFGFATEAQFRSWFYREDILLAYKSEGFALSVYEVPEHLAVLGDTQAIFNRAASHLVERRDLLTGDVLPDDPSAFNPKAP